MHIQSEKFRLESLLCTAQDRIKDLTAKLDRRSVSDMIAQTGVGAVTESIALREREEALQKERDQERFACMCVLYYTRYVL